MPSARISSPAHCKPSALSKKFKVGLNYLQAGLPQVHPPSEHAMPLPPHSSCHADGEDYGVPFRNARPPTKIEEERITNYRAQNFYPYVAEPAISQHDNKVATSRHLQSVKTDHPKKGLLRFVEDEFVVSGPHGTHPYSLFQPLGMTFTQFKNCFPGQTLPKNLQQTLQLVLLNINPSPI